MKKLISPKTPPTKTKICQAAVNSIPKRLLWPGIISKETPGTNLVAKNIPRIPAIICKNNFVILRRAQYDPEFIEGSFSHHSKNLIFEQASFPQLPVIGDGESVGFISKLQNQIENLSRQALE